MGHEEEIEELRGLYVRIYTLYDMGKDRGGDELLKLALEKSMNIEAYHLFFEGIRYIRSIRRNETPRRKQRGIYYKE